MCIKKMIMLISLVSLCVLSACDKKENKESVTTATGTEQKETQKEQKEISKPSASTGMQHYDYESKLSETEDGYYFYMVSQHIYYVDKKTMEATPLCFNLDCQHLFDESCQAFVRNVRNLQLYKGKLYVDITTEKQDGENSYNYVNLYRMDLDGSNREKVMELFTNEGLSDEESSRSLSLSFNWVIAGDNVYVCGSQVINDKEGEDYIDVYSLKNGKKIKRVYEEKISSEDDNYYMSSYYDEENQFLYFKKYSLGYGNQEHFFRVSVKNHTCKIMWEERPIADYMLYQDEWYYKMEDWLYHYNQKTKEPEEYIHLDGINYYANIITDDQYIYVDNNQAQNHSTEEKPIKKEDLYITIYNNKKEAVDTLKIPLKTYVIYNGTDKMLMDTGDKLYYFDKNAIGTGQLELKEINK